MLPRVFSSLAPRRVFSASAKMATMTPMEDGMRDKINKTFKPTSLVIRNDSHRHAHHDAMKYETSKETHFHVTIVSKAFEDEKYKRQPARHRLVYALLGEEMAQEGGIHALQLRTQTPAEEEREKEQKKELA